MRGKYISVPGENEQLYSPQGGNRGIPHSVKMSKKPPVPVFSNRVPQPPPIATESKMFPMTCRQRTPVMSDTFSQKYMSQDRTPMSQEPSRVEVPRPPQTR